MGQEMNVKQYLPERLILKG